MRNVFAGANVLIAGADSRSGASRAVLMLAEVGLFRLVVCPQVLDEAERNFRRKLPQVLPLFAAIMAALNLPIVPDPPPAANHVIHAARGWNPAIENQATDRVHRIGQDKTVYVYRIMVENTLEERMEELLQEKQGMADQIMGAATAGAPQWTRAELLQLLKPLD